MILKKESSEIRMDCNEEDDLADCYRLRTAKDNRCHYLAKAAHYTFESTCIAK